MKEETDFIILVWVVEDDEKYQTTIQTLLGASKNLECTSIYSDCETVLKQLKKKNSWVQPDVILLDINLPGISGLEALHKIKTTIPESKIVMLSIKDDRDSICEALRNGASGYLTKNTPPKEIVKAIHEASRGGMLMRADVAEKVLYTFKTHDNFNMTKREKEVLGKMADGHSQKQIADVLCISHSTVNTHIQHIYEKLQVNSAPEAVAKAIRNKEI